MYRDHRYRKSKTGRTWEPEYLRFPGSRDRVIIHRLPLKGLAFSPDPQKFSVGVQILSQTQLLPYQKDQPSYSLNNSRTSLNSSYIILISCFSS